MSLAQASQAPMAPRADLAPITNALRVLHLAQDSAPPRSGPAPGALSEPRVTHDTAQPGAEPSVTQCRVYSIGTGRRMCVAFRSAGAMRVSSAAIERAIEGCNLALGLLLPATSFSERHARVTAWTAYAQELALCSAEAVAAQGRRTVGVRDVELALVVVAHRRAAQQEAPVAHD